MVLKAILEQKGGMNHLPEQVQMSPQGTGNPASTNKQGCTSSNGCAVHTNFAWTEVLTNSEVPLYPAKQKICFRGALGAFDGQNGIDDELNWVEEEGDKWVAVKLPAPHVITHFSLARADTFSHFLVITSKDFQELLPSFLQTLQLRKNCCSEVLCRMVRLHWTNHPFFD